MEWMFPNAINCVFDGFLFQSGYMPTQDRAWLKRLKIEAIVNCASHDIPSKFADDGICYFDIQVDDCPEDSHLLQEKLEEATEFIAQQKQKKVNCLVHCAAGISRSSTVTLAYLIKYEGMSLDDAYDTLTNARRIAHPNEGFWAILQAWESQYHPEQAEKIKDSGRT
uniref:protein-tyrosine-phosphatase n=1 Tax=Vannella robusta TaxID=1487602 RepID=A0A7S4HYK1_9EUKA|mmetsp:Transcript_1772/g.2229  ORF Transcript_1772/g.2229 Transcript_1772/m.2229 type:complete len:167 (+) Transcript_1772:112-612(+)